MPWKERLNPLDPSDPRNADWKDPQGERIRFRINVVRGQVVDFLVQYETPVSGLSTSHLPVVRFDGSHGEAHYHVLAVDGTEVRRLRLPDHLSYNDAVQLAVARIERDWQHLRSAFFGRGK
ncbi:MAG: DUF7718 family protein [Thermomicrobiales bacterium]